MPEPWRGRGYPSGHPESRAAGHPGAAEDWAAGGAAGDDAEERDGQWCLPVSALRGDVGIPRQLLCILQRLQEESLHQVWDRGFPRPEAAPVAV